MVKVGARALHFLVNWVDEMPACARNATRVRIGSTMAAVLGLVLLLTNAAALYRQIQDSNSATTVSRKLAEWGGN
jgi:multisubunit Na+/H+ antiporter MnhB subunit